jgi:hypothetical protein
VVVIRTRSPTFSIASAFAELIVCNSSCLRGSRRRSGEVCASGTGAAIWSSSGRSGSGVLDGGLAGAPA